MKIIGYPKIYAIGHAAVKDLFKDEVQISEKIDGSQISFCKSSNDLFFKSRGAVIHADNPEKMFLTGVENIKAIKDVLHEGWIYRGEYLRSPKHNTLAYDRAPKQSIILFDITIGLEEYLTYDRLKEEAERIGLEVVPLLHEGKVDNAEALFALLDRKSILGTQKIEGIVVKNYRRFGTDGSVLMGKYVREDFKELNNRNWRQENPTQGDIVQQLIQSLKTTARWEKAIQHLRDKGNLDNSPRDIGNLIKEVQEDIKIEESQWIKDKLYEHFISQITRGSVAGIPEWYKERLAKSAFERLKSKLTKI